MIATLRREFRRLWSAWEAAQAVALALWQGDHLLLAQPDAAAVRQAQAVDCVAVAPLGEPLHLCVYGALPAGALARLKADAFLLGRLLHKEGELDAMATDFVAQQDQLLALYKLARAIRSQVDLPSLLQTLADEVRGLLGGADVILMARPPQGVPVLAGGSEGATPQDAYDLWFDAIALVNQRVKMESSDDLPPGVENVLLIPMRVDEAVTAVLAVLNHPGGFPMPTIKLLEAVAEQAATHVENALRYEEKLRQTRLLAQMALARQVQASLLPERLPPVPGLEVWAASIAALEVGGDFYDLAADGDLAALSLGDVSGKGMSAAMLMAMARVVLRPRGRTPRQVLAHANERLYDDLTRVGAFITVIVATYAPESGLLTYANAGHSPVIYCPAQGAARILEADSPPLGVLPQSMAQDHSLTLQAGDLFVIASDGLPETFNAAGEMFGYDAMLALIEANRARSAAQIGDLLETTISAFRGDSDPSDDRTLMVVRRVPGPDEGGAA